jgi:hypothetical protein
MAIQMYCSSCAKNIQWRPLKGFAKKKVLCKLLSIERVRFVCSQISLSLQGYENVFFFCLSVILSVCLIVCLSLCLFCLTLTLDVHFLAAADTSSRPTRQTCKQRRKREKEKFCEKKKIIENKDSQIASPLCCYVRCMSCVRARCQNCKLCRNEKKHFCEKNLCPVRKDLEKPISNIFLQSQKVLKSILLKHLMENWILFCKAIKVIVIQTFIGSFGFKTHNWMNDNFSIKLTLLSLQWISSF